MLARLDTHGNTILTTNGEPRAWPLGPVVLNPGIFSKAAMRPAAVHTHG